jgi:hypothetical protein
VTPADEPRRPGEGIDRLVTTECSSRIGWTAFFLLVPALLGMGAYYYLQLSRTLLPHSDIASMVLCAWDMLHGNFFLHGWTLDVNRAWLTEAPVYMAGLAVTRDLDPGLMHIVPVVIFLVVVVLAAAAATAGLEAGFARRTALIIAILPLVLLARPMIPWVLMGPYHTGTAGIVLAAALVLHLRERPRSGRLSRAALAGTAFALLAAGELSDPYTTVLGAAPIAITSVWRAAGVRPLARRLERLFPAAIAGCAWIAATIGLRIVTHFGGFTPLPFARPVIPFAKLGESLSNLTLAFLDLSGANFFGRAPDIHFIAYAVRLAYLAGGIYAVWSVLRHPRFKEDWLGTVLAVAVALAIVGGALGDDTTAYRYRVPPLIFAGAVLGRYVAITFKMWLEQRKALAAVLIVAVTFVFAWSPQAVLSRERLAGPEAKFGPRILGRWLEQHGLTSGYGEYWIAPITPVETRGKVRVRPVETGEKVRGALRVEPFHVNSNAAWYTGSNATFLVLDPQGRSWDRRKAVRSTTAADTFGPPNHKYVVGPYKVLVWDKPLKF